MKVRLCIMLLCLLGLSAQPAVQAQTQTAQLPLIRASRVVAVGDIHGAYQALTESLQAAALLDQQLRWQGRDSRLVLLGDLVDRGSQSRQVLDLVMRLEVEAAEAGGAVDVILGNHEVMNLTGDLRYVSREDLANYRDLEDPVQRQQALTRFLLRQDETRQTVEELQAEFERRYPSGFFGYRAAFALNGVYGEWLRQKPVLIRINDSAFVHGGILFRNGELDPGAINLHAGELLQGYQNRLQQLVDGNVLFPESDFNDHPALIRAWLDGLDEFGQNSALAAIARETELLWQDDFFDSDSPIWYRGMVSCSPWLEYDRLHSLLDTLAVSRLVVGHSPTSNHLVQSRFDDALLFADTGALKSFYGGQASAVLIEAGQVRVLYPENPISNAPSPQPRMIGPRPIAIDDDQLEGLLGRATIISSHEREDGNTDLEMADGELRFMALFTPAVQRRRRSAFIPEVAAYRLDRLLSLDMVPVAVMREVNRYPGAVSVPADGAWINEVQRRQSRQLSAWCALDDQFQLMYMFDKLINNRGRSGAEILYQPTSWQITLTGNRRILAPDNTLPAYLEQVPLLFSRYMLARLAELDSDLLQDELGDVLDRARRRALLRRRDSLLRLAATASDTRLSRDSAQ